MKNHFYMSYPGNKREEVEKIYNNINFEGIDTIVEPFCGSSAISFYIWQKHPNMKFVLNDANKRLWEMYQIIKDDDKTKQLEKEYNYFFENMSKERYNIFKNQDSAAGWLLFNKFYGMRPGLYNINYKKETHKPLQLSDFPIFKFYREADITFTCGDAIEVIEKYKDESNCAMFLDPPYIDTCNQFYDYGKTKNVYEWLYKNDIKNFKCFIMCILEDNWIIRLLFNSHTIVEYAKTYQLSKKKTTHIIVTK